MGYVEPNITHHGHPYCFGGKPWGSPYPSLHEMSVLHQRYIRQIWPNIPVVLNYQRHGNVITMVQKKDTYVIEGDGLFSQTQGVALGVRTADCVPVLFSSPRAVAVAHAGWRGVSLGILERMVTLFHTQGEQDIHAFIGPAIEWAYYEVHQDMYQQVVVRNPVLQPFFYTHENKLFFDIKKAVESILQTYGIQVHDVGIDTYTHKDFHSYRFYKKHGGLYMPQVSFVTLS